MKIIYLAGINNSGPGHWQYAWFHRLGGLWVDHQDWDTPKAGDWVEDLEQALAKNPGPKILVAHSLGTLLVAQWAENHRDPGIKGAFLVAPPDVSSFIFPRAVEGFQAPREAPLPFPSVLVASRNDPYSSFEYAEKLAAQWGARLIDVGEKGHINLRSGLGDWKEGFELFGPFYGESLSRV
jgi:predicted alpha/beta hydrolase family esterase